MIVLVFSLWVLYVRESVARIFLLYLPVHHLKLLGKVVSLTNVKILIQLPDH